MKLSEQSWLFLNQLDKLFLGENGACSMKLNIYKNIWIAEIIPCTCYGQISAVYLNSMHAWLTGWSWNMTWMDRTRKSVDFGGYVYVSVCSVDWFHFLCLYLSFFFTPDAQTHPSYHCVKYGEYGSVIVIRNEKPEFYYPFPLKFLFIFILFFYFSDFACGSL